MRDALHDRQAQPGAAVSGARFVEPRKGALQAIDFARGHARASVEDSEDDLACLLAQRELDRLAGVSERVVHQVHERAAHRQLRQWQFVANAGRTAPRNLPAEAPVVLDHLVGEGVEVGWLALLGRAAREIEKLTDHLVGFLDVGAHPGGDRFLGAAHLQREAQARQRIQQAVTEGQQVAAEIKVQAQADAQERLARAEDEIHREREKAKELLKQHIVGLAVRTAEKILRQNLDDKAQRKLASEFIDEVGAPQ